MKIGECTRERLVLVVDTLGRGSLGMCSEALATPEKVVAGRRPPGHVRGSRSFCWPPRPPKLTGAVPYPSGGCPGRATLLGGGDTVAGRRRSPWVFPAQSPPRWPPALGARLRPLRRSSESPYYQSITSHLYRFYRFFKFVLLVSLP